MKDYDVRVKVTGYYETTVRARNRSDAEQEANSEVENADFGPLENIDWEVEEVEVS